jgi:hypothetical protein
MRPSGSVPTFKVSRVIDRLRNQRDTFAKVFARLGLLIALLFVVDSVLSRFIRAHILLVQVFDPACFESRTNSVEPDVEIRAAMPAEIAAASKLIPEVLCQDFVETALGKGDTCIGVFVRNELVSFQWFSLTKTSLTEDVSVTLPATFLYAYNSYTVPGYRGLHYHAQRRIFAGRMLAAKRQLTMVAIVNADNSASILASAYMPPSRTGIAFLWRRQHGLLAMRSPLCKRIDLQFQNTTYET